MYSFLCTSVLWSSMFHLPSQRISVTILTLILSFIINKVGSSNRTNKLILVGTALSWIFSECKIYNWLVFLTWSCLYHTLTPASKTSSNHVAHNVSSCLEVSAEPKPNHIPKHILIGIHIEQIMYCISVRQWQNHHMVKEYHLILNISRLAYINGMPSHIVYLIQYFCNFIFLNHAFCVS